MKAIKINGSLRESLNKQNVKALRNAEMVPCVIYGGSEPVHFSTPAKEFKKLVYTPDVYTVELNIAGTEYRTIMQDIQFHAVSDEILHIDFLMLQDDKEVLMDIPVKLTGTAVGVRRGGKLTLKARKLKVKALPANLPDMITIAIDKLDIGKSVRVKDINIKGVELVDAKNNVIVAVKTARVVVAEEEPAAVEEGAEGAEAATEEAAAE